MTNDEKGLSLRNIDDVERLARIAIQFLPLRPV